jgi:hypothetical protein
MSINLIAKNDLKKKVEQQVLTRLNGGYISPEIASIAHDMGLNKPECLPEDIKKLLDTFLEIMWNKDMAEKWAYQRGMTPKEYRQMLEDIRIELLNLYY